jgi:hypothetical protein
MSDETMSERLKFAHERELIWMSARNLLVALRKEQPDIEFDLDDIIELAMFFGGDRLSGGGFSSAVFSLFSGQGEVLGDEEEEEEEGESPS